MVIDAAGNMLGSHAHAIDDSALLQQVSQSIISAVDSMQLVQEDWELVTATYSDGKVLIRNLRPTHISRTVILGVIADGRLNASFAGENLETPIVPGTEDEVGRMAKSLDRLRSSLSAAMERLGE